MWVVAEHNFTSYSDNSSFKQFVTSKKLSNTQRIWNSLENVKEQLRAELDEQSEICVLASLLVFHSCSYLLNLAIIAKTNHWSQLYFADN